MRNPSFFSLIAIVAVGVSAASVHGAEIRPDPKQEGTLVLEGVIRPGDFDALRKLVFDVAPNEIYLASPGGDVAEAMKIGRFLRAMKMETTAPDNNPGFRDRLAAIHGLKDSDANYMCASACFFAFVGGIYRKSAFVDEGILGIHRPFLSQHDLMGQTSDDAMDSSARIKLSVGHYMREMGVPAKYTDRMFRVGKDEISWVTPEEFRADFDGFIPELKDWVNARCDKRTAADKQMWEAIKNKSEAQMTTAEKILSSEQTKKFEEQFRCEARLQANLALSAFAKAKRALSK